MRNACLCLLALFSACAANRHTEDQPATARWDGQGLVYETTRPATPAPEGSMTADLTLLELDEAEAKTLLGIEDAGDIAPRSFKQAMGEIAAVNACYGHGRVLARASLALKPGEEATWTWSIEHVYLQDWKLQDGERSPVFATVADGVELKLAFTPVNIGDNIKLESDSSQVAWPVQEFKASTNPTDFVIIQIPELARIQRIATETLGGGETAMFQLSRAAYQDRTRIRLLFVRLSPE